MNILERMNGYSKLSSWAMWESNNSNGLLEKEKDLKEDIDFNKYIDILQPSNFVILAMNPGGIYNKDDAKKATRKIVNNKRQWSNFHNIGRSRDYLLGRAMMETKLKGSYMTDLFPIEGSASNDVKKFINNKDNIGIVNRLIEEFDEEMTCLIPNHQEVRLICLGSTVEKWAKVFLVGNNKLNKTYYIYKLPHYSSSNQKQVSSDPKSEKFYPTVVKRKIEEYKL